MTTEKFANLAEGNLATAYAGGGGSISLISASGFPSTGNFRVRLGNGFKTLLKVTAVAGTTFTVSVEANDGAAPAGTAVVLVNTAGAEDARKADQVQLATYAGIPVTEKAGILILTSDGVVIVRDNGAGLDYFGPLTKVIPLDQSAWTWFNQGAAIVNQQGGLVYLQAPAGVGGTNLRGRLRGSYPATPFTLTVGVRPQFQFVPGAVTNLNALGFTISDGTQHKVLVVANFNFNTANGPNAIWVGKYTSATAASAATVLDQIQLNIDVTWLRVVDDGVNQTFYYSLDKINWIQVLQEARTTFLTPSDIGIVVTNQNGGIVAGGDIVSWELT
jgi:hypothetical protein